MPDEIRERALQRLLFESHTTYRADFNGLTITEPIFTRYQKKPTKVRAPPAPLKGIHTLSNWKKSTVPFNLFHQKQEITRTDPRVVQQPFENEQDPLRAEIQKTRPRLVMTPAFSMDDIEDTAREILINDIYISDMTRGNREVAGDIVHLNVKSPFPGLPAPANPVFLPKLQPQYVPPEWRMQTVSWDNRQLRCHCDTTAEFWLRRKISFCNACKETAIVNRQRNLEPAMPR